MVLSNFAIQHKTTVIILTVIIVFVGTSAYLTMPREAAPDISFPYIFVVSNYSGTSPADMESLVTRPIERKLKGITGIKKMTSTSKEGLSMIVIEFNLDVDSDTAMQKVRDKVSQAKGDLPNDMNDPAITEMSSSDWPIMYVVISGEVGIVKLKKIADDLKDQIEMVAGVLEVRVSGDREREIRIEFDQDRLAAYGLTMAAVVQKVQNDNKNVPGGTLDIGEARYVMKSPAEFTSPAEIDHVVVAVKNEKPVYLTDVAAVRDTFKDRESFARLNQMEAVSIRITKRSGEHLLRVAAEIKKITEEAQRILPPQVTITITSDGSKEINTLVNDLGNSVITAILLVMLVIFLALGARNALQISTAIPLSMLITFAVLQSLNITLNFVVLFSLILVVGILVDDAIVVVENIYRHYASGNKSRGQAAMEATAEVAWPVITSTLTTIVAFFPLLFWPGIMGKFLSFLPKTVIISLSASLFVALVINPTLSAIFLKHAKGDRRMQEEEHAQHYGFIIATYRRLLSFTLHYKKTFLACFFSLFLLMTYAFVKSDLGVELFPNTQPARINVNIKTPEGTNIRQTNKFAVMVEKIIQQYGNIEHVTTTVGSDSSGNSDPINATITVDLVDKELRQSSGTDGKIYHLNSNEMVEVMRKEMLAKITGAEVRVDKESMGPPVGKPVNVEIHGADYATLANISKELRNVAQNIPGIVDLSDDYQAALPEIKVTIDKERATLLDLDAALIGQFLKAAVNGTTIGSYREGEDEYDITLRLPEDQRRDIQNILRLRIPGYGGEQVPLSSVATITTTSGLASIKHIDTKRVVTVSSNVAEGFNSQKILGEVQRLAAAMKLPEGYQFAYTGEQEEMQDSQAFIFKAFVTAVLLIAFVIVAQFDSMATTFIIMATVILAFIGVFFNLMVTQKPFGVMMTGMGVVSLAGVVVKNGIVMIDYINILRKRGLAFADAIITGGATRFRPVLLTATTAILGLVPMATGIDFNFLEWKWSIDSSSSEMWRPLANCVIFGLSFATVLTLFVVPCLYSLFFGRSDKKLKLAKEPILEMEPPFEQASEQIA